MAKRIHPATEIWPANDENSWNLGFYPYSLRIRIYLVPVVFFYEKSRGTNIVWYENGVGTRSSNCRQLDLHALWFAIPLLVERIAMAPCRAMFRYNRDDSSEIVFKVLAEKPQLHIACEVLALLFAANGAIWR